MTISRFGHWGYQAFTQLESTLRGGQQVKEAEEQDEVNKDEVNTWLPETWVPKEIFQYIVGFVDLYPAIFVNKTWHELVVTHPSLQKVIKVASFIQKMHIANSSLSYNFLFSSLLFSNPSFELDKKLCKLKAIEWQGKLVKYQNLVDQNQAKPFSLFRINTDKLSAKICKMEERLVDIEKYKDLLEPMEGILSNDPWSIDRLPLSLADLLEEGNIKGLATCIGQIQKVSDVLPEKILKICFKVFLEKGDLIRAFRISCLLEKSSGFELELRWLVAKYIPLDQKGIINTIRQLIKGANPLEALRALEMLIQSFWCYETTTKKLLALQSTCALIGLMNEIHCNANEEQLKQEFKREYLLLLAATCLELEEMDMCFYLLEQRDVPSEATISLLLSWAGEGFVHEIVKHKMREHFFLIEPLALSVDQSLQLFDKALEMLNFTAANSYDLLSMQVLTTCQKIDFRFRARGYQEEANAFLEKCLILFSEKK